MVARLVNPVIVSLRDFQLKNLICTRNSAKKLKANLSKKWIVLNFFCLRRFQILDEIMPQMEYPCCIFVAIIMNLFCMIISKSQLFHVCINFVFWLFPYFVFWLLPYLRRLGFTTGKLFFDS